jgi:hypothetical protein
MVKTMKIEDIYQEKNDSQWTEDQIKSLWPQARGELLGFANHLARTNAKITAEQLKMAVFLADRSNEILKERNAMSYWINGASIALEPLLQIADTAPESKEDNERVTIDVKLGLCRKLKQMVENHP